MGLQHETLLAVRLCLLIGFLGLFGLLIQAYSFMLWLAVVVVVATVFFPMATDWLLCQCVLGFVGCPVVCDIVCVHGLYRYS